QVVTMTVVVHDVMVNVTLKLIQSHPKIRMLQQARTMGKRNYLIEGVSGTGKTSVAEELQRRGYHVIHGDRELKYRGDPKTGESVNEPVHESERDKAVWQQENLLWAIDKVKSVIADRSKAISFFCGGSRNFSKFIDL